MERKIGKKTVVMISVLLTTMALITPLWAAVVTTNTYNVTGNTLEEVWDSIQANSPNPGHAPGYANSELVPFRTDAAPVSTPIEDHSCPYNYRYEVSITRTITWSIKTTITLPKWTDGYAPCAEVKAEWDRFLAALTTHEKGHDQAVEDALKNAKPLTTITGVGSDCVKATAIAKAQADLEAKYAAEKQRLRDALNAANTKYETDTQNGKTQGAVLNCSVVCHMGDFHIDKYKKVTPKVLRGRVGDTFGLRNDVRVTLHIVSAPEGAPVQACMYFEFEAGYRKWSTIDWVPGKYVFEVVDSENFTVILLEAPVGDIWVSVDKFVLLAPYIALASTILVATAATAIYVKRRNKKQ